jgi:hypothetical protein
MLARCRALLGEPHKQAPKVCPAAAVIALERVSVMLPLALEGPEKVEGFSPPTPSSFDL